MCRRTGNQQSAGGNASHRRFGGRCHKNKDGKPGEGSSNKAALDTKGPAVTEKAADASSMGTAPPKYSLDGRGANPDDKAKLEA